MKSYLEVKASIPVPKPVFEERVFYAYKGGICKEFKSKADALAYSNLVETVIKNADEMAAYKQAGIAMNQAIAAAWLAELKQEFNALVAVDAFDKAYEYAIDRCENDDNADIVDVLHEFQDVVLQATTFLLSKPKG